MEPTSKAESSASHQTKKRKASWAREIYLAVWRWHFWSGLLITPFLIILSVTGALYVFKPQIEDALYSEYLQIDPVAEATPSFDAFITNLEKTYPGVEVTNILVKDDPRSPWESYLEIPQENNSHTHLRLFYDPYRDQIIGSTDFENSFFFVVLQLHRNLMIGLPGRLITELATSWGILSILSGLLLWWPKGKEKVMGVWIPRLNRSRKILLRDLHVVPAVYISIFVIAIMFTGLLFTRVWGTAWLAGNALSGGFPDVYTNPPQSILPAETDEQLERTSIDKAFFLAKEVHDYEKGAFSIRIPELGQTQAIQFQTDLTNPFIHQALAYIDLYSGALLAGASSAEGDLPLRTRLTLLFYPIHTGLIFGLGTQILAFFVCLVIILMSITGVWMWWRRRPKGEMGMPSKIPDPAPKWLVIGTVSFAAFLPTVGISLMGIFLVGFIRAKFFKK